jgi:hypothetical protein
MRQQTTPHLLMVRPANFGFNAETAENNAFQSRDQLLSGEEIRRNALIEFDRFVATLRAGVDVIVAEDSASPVKPDAVFPNNWVTFHQEGHIITYPMFASTRRLERREAIIQKVLDAGFTQSGNREHLEASEAVAVFLEGTGSIIFDHEHRLAYACLSPRTDVGLLEQLCRLLGYQKVVFHSVDGHGQDIYHTNVMMALGETFVVICLDSVRDAQERAMLEAIFARTGKAIVDISLEQMNTFAGNMLQVQNVKGDRILVMSEQAYRALTANQVATLKTYTQLLYSDIKTIETYGGGSARCMMAEIFLPKV